MPETVQALRVWRGLRDQALTPRVLGGGVDAELAQLAVERRAADAEAAGDFGHAPAIMADGEADDVGLDLLEAAQMAVGAVERDARAAGQRGVARRLGDVGRDVVRAAGEARLDRDVREILGGQRDSRRDCSAARNSTPASWRTLPGQP